MKTLIAKEIEALLGVGSTSCHPLNILGFGFTTEGVKQFRAEQPDFFPQVAAYIRQKLDVLGYFPMAIDVAHPGQETFIGNGDAGYFLSSLEEIGLLKFLRVSKEFDSVDDVISAYVERVANRDYIRATMES